MRDRRVPDSLKENKMDNKTLKFEFTVDETNDILKGLNELPFRIAQPLIKKVVDVANAQIEQPPQPEAANT